MFEVAMRYETAQAVRRLTEMLNLPETGQDFDLEAADPDRIQDFCDVYESADLTAEEKFALMMLIISSYNDHLACEGADQSYERIERLLQQDYALHFHTVEYWASLDADESEEEQYFRDYPVCPLMRRVWRCCTPPLLVAATLGDAALNDDEVKEGDTHTLNSALMRASELGHGMQVEQLLQQGADPNARDLLQRTGLHYSAGSGHGDIVTLLVRHGAELNIVDEFGWTPLSMAICNSATNERDSAVGQLLFLGADPSIADSNGYTPLLTAVELGQQETVCRLLPVSDASVCNSRGEDALAIAKRHNYEEIVQILSNPSV